MKIKIQLRRDREENWGGYNPILASGEIGIAIDKGLFKIGNGVDDWGSLKYATVPTGSSTSGGLSIGQDSSSSYGGISVGNNTESSYSSVSVGTQAKSESNGVAVGTESSSTGSSISVGYLAESSGNGVSVGMESSSAGSSISVGLQATSENYSISVGANTISSGSGINIGNDTDMATDGVMVIGTSAHNAVKIPGSAGATNGLTLKINSVGNLYA
ncbi:MAG TPA: hypothetical protein VFC79_09125, partial [Tissierellaceae bacterium]|nr:hypothetical protein [Tissierellaceae bacterium]